MFVRVKVAGIPNPVDPATWPFPTAALFGYDPVDGEAVFDVRDDDVPLDLLIAEGTKRARTPIGEVVTGADADTHAMWHSRLDDRYQERAGTFKPELA